MTSEFTDTLSLATFPQPNGICAACLLDHNASQGDPGGRFILTFCEHNRAGGVYVPALQLWKIYVPISRSAWEMIVASETAALAIQH